MKKKFFIGIDIGGTRTKIVLRSDCDKVLKNKVIDSNKEVSGYEFIELVIDGIYSLLKREKILNSQLLRVGIGVPGIFDSGAGSIINLPNFQSLNGLNLVGLFCDEFGLTEGKVRLCNDADLIYYYFKSEFDFAFSADENILFLTLGTHLGNSICLNGKLLTNKFGSCEFSHNKISDKVTSKVLLNGFESFSDCDLDNLNFEKYGKALGESISILHNIFCFDRIYLSGGVTYYYNKYFKEFVLKIFEKNSFFPVCDVKVLSNKKSNLGAIGASKIFDK